MGNEELELKSLLLSLERSLLTNAVRTDPHLICELLDAHFKECTSSGKIYAYKPGDVFGENADDISIIESSFEIRSLSSDINLVNYQTSKKNGDMIITTNRSSIWTKTDNKWKIIYHQGTNNTE